MNLHTQIKTLRIFENTLILGTNNKDLLYYYFRDTEPIDSVITGIEVALSQTDVWSFEVMLNDLNHGDRVPMDLDGKEIKFADYSEQKYNQHFTFCPIRVGAEVKDILKNESEIEKVKNIFFSDIDWEGDNENFSHTIDNDKLIRIRGLIQVNWL